jgi:hypothetical protein
MSPVPSACLPRPRSGPGPVGSRRGRAGFRVNDLIDKPLLFTGYHKSSWNSIVMDQARRGNLSEEDPPLGRPKESDRKKGFDGSNWEGVPRFVG